MGGGQPDRLGDATAGAVFRVPGQWLAAAGMTIEFLHAGLHADRLRQIRDARPVVIACPSCGGQWFADWPAAPLPLDWQDTILPAIAALTRECPDHAHRFSV